MFDDMPLQGKFAVLPPVSPRYLSPKLTPDLQKHMPQVKSHFGRALVALAWLCLVSAGSSEPNPLTGVANFRDIGGYKTSDGRMLKRHVIYRSGELSGATSHDQQILTSLQLRYEIDLRTDTERTESPSRWGDHPPEVISISVGMPRKSDPARSLNGAELRTASQARSYMQQTTARLALDGAADIGQVIRRLAEGDEPALIHCSAGKDRTGVTVAVLMTLLGVPRDQVDREYVKSNEAVDQQLERAKAREQSGASLRITDLTPDALRTMLGADASYLDAAFSAIDKQFGSFDAYTKNGLKITSRQIQALRARLLER
jgi:protein-tyrosine phosphatase